MQNRKVKALTVPLISAGLILISSPAQATPLALKPDESPKVSQGPKVGPTKTSKTRETKATRARIRIEDRTAITAEQAQVAIAAALSKENARYRVGGIGPNSFDCSGLVRWAFAQAGVELPHGTDNLLPIVQRITRDQLVPGDLIFSGRSGGGIQHVALYIGDGKVIHATHASASRANQVRIDDIDGDWVMVHKAYARVLQ